MTLLRTIFRNSILPSLRIYIEKTKWPLNKKHLSRDRKNLARVSSLFNNAPKIRRLKSKRFNLSKTTLYKFDLSHHHHSNAQQKAPHNKDPKRCIFYIHGGAFCINSPESYKLVLYKLAKYTNSVIYAPAYRLSPESCFPDAFEDCLEAYSFVINHEKIDPDKLVFGGDSAGGNLSVALCLHLSQSNTLPLPRGIFTFSPWLDLSMQGPSYKFNKDNDKLLTHESIRRAAWLYLYGNFDFGQKLSSLNSIDTTTSTTASYKSSQEEDNGKPFQNPLISPIYFNPTPSLRQFPPILFLTAADECLLSDSLIFGRKLNTFLSQDSYNKGGNFKVEEISSPDNPVKLTMDESENTFCSSQKNDMNNDSDRSTSDSYKPYKAFEHKNQLSIISTNPSDDISNNSAFQKDVINSVSLSQPIHPCEIGENTFEKHLSIALPDNKLETTFSNDMDTLDSLGKLSEEDRLLLQHNRKIYASGCNPILDPNIRATIVLWKDEYHAFAMFGPLENPYSKQCLKDASQWILQRVP